MKIYLPQGISQCSNRAIKARTNLTSGGPEDWFTPNNLKKFGYKSFNFDFFVNWDTNQFVRTLWFKRFLDVSVNEFVKNSNWKQLIRDSIINFEGRQQLEDILAFCSKYNVNADLLLFNEEQWNDQELIIYTRLQNDNIAVKTITLDELKVKIKIGTGRPFNIGRKGLIYSASQLECYLSVTDTPYPGDADLLLVNDDFSELKLIEFKKHNMQTPISQQNLFNYFPKPDGAKYRRLDILRQYLPNTQMYTVYYTTDDRYQTKIELNSYDNYQLHQGRSKLIPSPKNINDEDDIMTYLSTCVDFFNVTPEL